MPGRVKQINWNSSYYTAPFNPCKPYKEFNSFEMAKAHGNAVEMFRLCGMTKILPFATRLNFPAFAIMKLTDIFCFICSIGGGYFDLIGRQNTKNDTEADTYLVEIRAFCNAWEKLEYPIVVKDGNTTFRIRSNVCNDFIFPIFECGFKKIGMRDAEHAKYTVGHFRKMLL